ncbi:chloramphenicol-sensitive protein RarD [Paraburkholderia caballeronis]|nr:chloramphenicol-sensitive protein RarD [Paraburkholderia caballeronis]TDV15912.1 chloramphenicol-sensitive protein RarD [Paraburkholderia caballeronis]TDV25173.1 chloramphenicol-sensitive protein RarD [Paraburkholderia caballeronis]
MNPGIPYALLAFVLWGLFPVYFKTLHQIPALEMLAHRMAWSLLFVAAVLVVRRHWRWLGAALGDRRVVGRFTASAALLSANWGIYIWAVNAGHIVEASLGYFINPLFNVLFGYAFLGERLRPLQGGAIALAAAGVVYLTWQNGAPPWISLALAATFGGYGLMRKTARLGALEGLTMETLLLFPVALLYLAVIGWRGESAFAVAPASLQFLLALAGPITAVPLLLFAAAARRISLSTLGVIQYVTPTLQLLTGVLIYREPFGHVQMLGYGAIWVALALYSLEGMRNAAALRGARPGAGLVRARATRYDHRTDSSCAARSPSRRASAGVRSDDVCPPLRRHGRARGRRRFVFRRCVACVCTRVSEGPHARRRLDRRRAARSRDRVRRRA